MFSIGVLGFIVWAHHMARVNGALSYKTRLKWSEGKVHCCGYTFYIFTLKDMVAKQASKGRRHIGEYYASINLSASILAKLFSPNPEDCRDKKMNPRTLSPCATVQEFYSSIPQENDVYTCGTSSQSFCRLLANEHSNRYKNVGVPKQSVFPLNRLSYVMPGSLKGAWTRSSVNALGTLNVYHKPKGTEIFVRHFSSNESLNKDGLDRSSEVVSAKLSDLIVSSKNDNIEKVNEITLTLLGMPEFWILQYESIKGNPGVHTPGGSAFSKNKRNKILDGIDLDFFHKLSKTILRGSFRFGPIRRVDIPKPQGGTRPLGIADARDKIVQKGLATILECLSEHKFLDCSHGFRRGRSCHTALTYVRNKVPSGMWAIEGDISKCFDRFNHKIIVSLVRKKYVSQQVFIDLLYKALKARIVTLDSSWKVKVGTPQGSVVSPILCNICLHELDQFVQNGNTTAKFRKGRAATRNPRFTDLLKLTNDERQTGTGILKTRGKLKMWKYFHKLRVSKLKLADKLNITRNKFKGQNRRMSYVRYADDFIVFVWGNKNDCLEVKSLIKNFLKGTLDLSLSEEKTKITYLKKNKANFLGFQLWQSPNTILSSKKDVNPMGKKDSVKTNAKFRGASMQVPRLRITFSMNSVLRRLVDKGLLRYKEGKFFPTSYKAVLQYPIPNIVLYLKAVFRGHANYFGFAHNWYDAKSIYNYYGVYCAAMTIAHKTKSKVPKVFKKYGKTLTIRDGEDKVTAHFSLLTNKQFKKSVKFNSATLPPNVEVLLKENLKIASKHLIKWPCVICGDPNAEMHHVKHIRKSLRKKNPKSFDAYLEAMRIVNRKTLPVCKEHHNMIHSGVYSGESLSTLFDKFKSNGVGFNKKKARDLVKITEEYISTQKSEKSE